MSTGKSLIRKVISHAQLLRLWTLKSLFIVLNFQGLVNRVGIEIVVASFVIHGVHFLDLFTLKWALIDVHFLNLFNMDSWSIHLAKFLVLLDCITHSL